MNIRLAKLSDSDDIWSIVKPVLRAGETYPLPKDITRQEGLAYWFAPEKTLFVAEDETEALIGLYYIKPNNQGGGDHICNCGYVTKISQRGKGIAQKLCQHSLSYAKQSGYRGMQYNLVVSTNKAAVYLWQKMGFKIVGTVPGIFHHPGIGDVDAHVMFQALSAQDQT